MANDAFALSPISASGALPSEADYHAISEAFMETARGRWFLKEYARRNRNADTAMVLEAVSRIETTLAMQKRQVPVGGLVEAMELIRPIIAEASAAASRATEHLTSDDAFAPSRKGVRIIREVAWQLREIGYDGRICDILEGQTNAIAMNERSLALRQARDAVLSAFDQMTRQIGDLADHGSATAPAAGPAPVQPVHSQSAPIQHVAENVVSLKPVVQSAPQAGPAVAPRSVADAPVPPPAVAPQPAASREVEPPAAVVLARPATSPKSEQSVPLQATASAAATAKAEQINGAVEYRRPAEPRPTSSTSLGEALLARGMVHAPSAKTTPLAPIRRMSQAEKIAFFS